jgi:hypothetical protein
MDGVNFKTITYPFRDFYRRVRNVFRWLPTIWNDRDWDDSYITEILIKKLEFTRDFYLSGKSYKLHSNQTAEEIQEAIIMLHMTRDSWEFYEEPAADEIERKWGKTTFEFIPLEDKPGLSEMVSNTEKVKTPEDREQYSKEFRESMMKTRKEYMKDKRKAYRYIADHIDGWWD